MLFYYLLIHLFLAVLGLRCCVQALSSFGKWGLLFSAVGSTGYRPVGFSNCSTWAQKLPFVGPGVHGAQQSQRPGSRAWAQ